MKLAIGRGASSVSLSSVIGDAVTESARWGSTYSTGREALRRFCSSTKAEAGDSPFSWINNCISFTTSGVHPVANKSALLSSPPCRLDASAIRCSSSSAFAAVADVRDEEAQAAAARATVAAHARLDVLVAAAGVAGGGPVHMIPTEEWQRVQDINLKGTFLSAKAVLPQMLEQRSGSIVTIASVEGLEGAEGGSTYNASKGGVVLLTKNLAMDLIFFLRQSLRSVNVAWRSLLS